MDRTRPEFFCSPELGGQPDAYQVELRPKVEFLGMLNKLDFKKLDLTCNDLNVVLGELDHIFEGFDTLSVSADKFDKNLMQSSLSNLEHLKFLPTNS